MSVARVCRALLLTASVIAVAAGLCACRVALPPDSPAERPHSDLIQAQPWPEADALFRSDPHWLGSDDAYSIDLGGGQVLWLFGDSFISRTPLRTRRLATMVRNSVGLQTGYDPSSATMAFYWRTQGSKPASFFPEEGDIWFWPGHGIVVGDRLLIFLMAIRSSSEGLGFETVGWRAVVVSGFDGAPSTWHLEWLETPPTP